MEVGVGSVDNGTVTAGNRGDLGVSSYTERTSDIKQAIDGTEGLRFDLDSVATRVTLNISDLEADEHGQDKHGDGVYECFH